MASIMVQDTSSVRLANSETELSRVLLPHLNAIVVARARPPVDLGVVCRERDPFEAHAWTRPALAEMARSLGTGRQQEVLAHDMSHLVDLYLALSRSETFFATLAIVDDDACSKFHSDNVQLRLLCTYAGPGTEIVPSHAVRREHIGRAELTPTQANPLIVPDPTAVIRAPTHAIVLLKGDRYPNNNGNGAVHRSPEVRASQGRRLLFKVDEAPPWSRNGAA